MLDNISESDEITDMAEEAADDREYADDLSSHSLDMREDNEA